MARATFTPSGEKQLYYKLVSGHNIPAVGLGTWRTDTHAYDAVYTAIVDAGYRHIDTASEYGVHKDVGRAIKAAIHTGLDRKDIFVTSKLCCSDLSPDRVRPALDAALEDLELEYLDLYLIHWPFRLREGARSPPLPGDVIKPDIVGVWREMEKLVKEKLVRDIGVCNFTAKKMEDLLRFDHIKPSVCQIEMHPRWRNDRMLEVCRRSGVHVTAYSPLGSAEGGRDLLREPTVVRVAEKLGKSPAQVLIRWAVHRGTSVIPKSTNPDRIKENISVFGWEIPEEDFMELSSFPNQKRVVDGAKLFVNEEGPFRNVEELWDHED